MPNKTAELITTLEYYGTIVAVDVSEADYLAHYADEFYEWIEGVVIKMSPASERHQEITHYLLVLMKTYWALNPIGVIRSEPFTLKIGDSYRQPDLQIILNDTPGLTATGMLGASDICIEIVSPESIHRDYEMKKQAYESAGVKEYWIIDPIKNETVFYRLENDHYKVTNPDDVGYYQTPLLPKLKIHVPTLWREEMPNIFEIGDTVKAMLNEV